MEYTAFASKDSFWFSNLDTSQVPSTHITIGRD